MKILRRMFGLVLFASATILLLVTITSYAGPGIPPIESGFICVCLILTISWSIELMFRSE